MFPEDSILIARGKYSTLNKERREQMTRVQKIVTSMVTASSQVLKNCHERVPNNDEQIAAIGSCVENLVKANERLMTIGLGLDELEDEAWGKNQQETA
jgi:hypothetical protein